MYLELRDAGCASRNWIHRVAECNRAAEAATKVGPSVSFSRDIVPILSDNCFKCHGPDAADRQANLRLDVRDVVIKPAESGEVAIVPGQPDASELVRRIFSTDDDERMPPLASHKSLTDAQRQLLRRWIAQGAVYQQHWACAPQAPLDSSPAACRACRVAAQSDRSFRARETQSHNLHPSAEADKVTLRGESISI